MDAFPFGGFDKLLNDAGLVPALVVKCQDQMRQNGEVRRQLVIFWHVIERNRS